MIQAVRGRLRIEQRYQRGRHIGRESPALSRGGEIGIDRRAAIEQCVVEIEDDCVDVREERGAK